jgi:alpha-mannosidase
MTDFVAPARDLADFGSALKLHGCPDVEITAFKKAYARDTLIVRLHNCSNKVARGQLTVGTDVMMPSAVYEVNLNEDRLNEIPLKNDSVSFELRGNGLLTFEFELSKK